MRPTEFCVLWGFVLIVGLAPAIWMGMPFGAALVWIGVSFVLAHVFGPGLERLVCWLLRLPPPNFI